MPEVVHGGAPEARLLVVDLASTAPVWSLLPEGAARLRDEAPDGWRVHVVAEPTVSDGDGASRPSDEVLRVIAGAEAYVGFGIPRQLFLAAPQLRWVHSAAAGVGGALFAEMLTSPVLLTNSAGVHAVPIAEHVIGGLLFLLRGLDIAGERQRASRWDRAPFIARETPLRELADCRALIVGTGGVGGAIADRLSAFGARCIGVRRRVERGAPPGFERVVALEAIDEELAHADILVLAAALTVATRGLISAERLRRLPAHAIVANVARGALLDQRALAALVAAGRLRGAVLDVFEDEPLASDSPLWQLRSVLVTPHVSAVSPFGYWRRELALILENWHRYVRGDTLLNLVDKRAGY